MNDAALLKEYVDELVTELRKNQKMFDLIRGQYAKFRFLKDIKDQYVIDAQSKIGRRLSRGEKSKITRYVNSLIRSKALNVEDYDFERKVRIRMEEKFKYGVKV